MSSKTITNRLENITVAISKLKSEQRNFHAEKKILNQKLINLESGNFMGDSCPTPSQINDLMEQISNLEQKIQLQSGMLKHLESLYNEAQLKQYNTPRNSRVRQQIVNKKDESEKTIQSALFHLSRAVASYAVINGSDPTELDPSSYVLSILDFCNLKAATINRYNKIIKGFEKEYAEKPIDDMMKNQETEGIDTMMNDFSDSTIMESEIRKALMEGNQPPDMR